MIQQALDVGVINRNNYDKEKKVRSCMALKKELVIWKSMGLMSSDRVKFHRDATNKTIKALRG